MLVILSHYGVCNLGIFFSSGILLLTALIDYMDTKATLIKYLDLDETSGQLKQQGWLGAGCRPYNVLIL